MTQEARTGTIRAAAPDVAPATDSARDQVLGRADRVLEGLWGLLTSMRFAMVVILAIAALGVLGALIIQAPPGVLADAEAKATWIAEVRPKFGGWTTLMDQLQLFQVFQSIWFRGLVAALAVSLVACSIHRIPGIWRTATKPRVDVGAPFFEHAPEHEAIVVHHHTLETSGDVVRTVLRHRHYRTVVEEDGALHLYADRFRWTPLASLAGHLSLVVILAGAIVGSTFGYRDSQFTVAEGATLPVAAEAGLSLQLVDFADTYYATTGAPEDYASQVVLYKDGSEVARHTIRVNDPLRYGDLTFYQAFFGSAAVMTVKDASGSTVVSQGVPMAWRTTEDDRPVGSFTIPGSGLVGWVIGTLGSGDATVKPGQMQLDLYQAEGTGERVGSVVLDQGKAASVAGLTVTFDREAQFTGLNVARDPGVLLVWIGAFLLFAGFVVAFFLPHRRVWARIVARPGGGTTVAVASLGRRDVALDTEFDGLVNDIRAALLAPAALREH